MIELAFKIIVGVLVLANTVYTINKAKKEKQKNSVADQITGFQESILKENASLKAEMKELSDKFQSVRASRSVLHYPPTSMIAAKWIKNTEGIRMHHNEAYERMTGHAAAVCIGLSDYHILLGSKNKESKYHQDQARKIAARWGKADRKVIRTGKATMVVEPCYHKDDPGAPFLVVSVKAPIFAPDGTVIGLEGMAIRLDEIKEAENNYHLK